MSFKLIRISIDNEEQLALQKLRLNRNSNEGERAYYVLLNAKGYSAPSIGRRLGRSVITIREWLSRYANEGVSGLKSIKQPGRPAYKAEILENELSVLLEKSPIDYGYQESGWQLNLFKDYFSKQDCHVCDNTLVKALKKLGYAYKRFSKTMPINAPTKLEKLAVISSIVKEIKNDSDDTEVFFGDESHFSNQPYVSRGWFKCGEKK